MKNKSIRRVFVVIDINDMNKRYQRILSREGLLSNLDVNVTSSTRRAKIFMVIR